MAVVPFPWERHDGNNGSWLMTFHCDYWRERVSRKTCVERRWKGEAWCKANCIQGWDDDKHEHLTFFDNRKQGGPMEISDGVPRPGRKAVDRAGLLCCKCGVYAAQVKLFVLKTKLCGPCNSEEYRTRKSTQPKEPAVCVEPHEKLVFAPDTGVPRLAINYNYCPFCGNDLAQPATLVMKSTCAGKKTDGGFEITGAIVNDMYCSACDSKLYL